MGSPASDRYDSVFVFSAWVINWVFSHLANEINAPLRCPCSFFYGNVGVSSPFRKGPFPGILVGHPQNCFLIAIVTRQRTVDNEIESIEFMLEPDIEIIAIGLLRSYIDE